MNIVKTVINLKIADCGLKEGICETGLLEPISYVMAILQIIISCNFQCDIKLHGASIFGLMAKGSLHYMDALMLGLIE